MPVEKVEYNDYPLSEILEAVNELRARGGVTCYQKFTCDKCGERQTIDEPDTFYAKGKCEECGHITDIEKKGCNYMVHFKLEAK